MYEDEYQRMDNRGGGFGGGVDDYYGDRPAPARLEQMIPEDVVDYLKHFKRCVLNGNVSEIYNLYEYGFNDLTERYYKDSRFWPKADEVSAKIAGKDDSKVFLILYKELYFRYVYARITRGPSLEIRYNSYQNYVELFQYLLEPENPVALQLPDRWIWDIIDEFVYQFQSFCQYKCNPSKRSADELQDLEMMETDLWNLYPVLNILYSIVAKSQIHEQLRALNAGDNPDDVANEFGRHPLYFKLGYFALIGLLRLHILIGDYSEALRTVQHLHFEPTGLYNTVPSCLVTLHYYVGFAHMMMRNYQESIKIFVNCLLFIQRTRNVNQNQTKTWQYDVIGKTNDQLFQLLAICLTLLPQRIDESVHSQLNEKLLDRMNRMAKGGEEALIEFESAFAAGCPKFLAPMVHLNDVKANDNAEPSKRINYAKEPTNHQVRIFKSEMKGQQWIPMLRGYLKLYSSIPVSKLASFMEEEEETVISALLSFKHKLYDKSAEGDDEDNTADLDFYIDKEMVYIADTKVGRRYGEYFIRHIQKLMELNNYVDKLGNRIKVSQSDEQHQTSMRMRGK